MPEEIDRLAHEWRFDLLASAFPQRGQEQVLKRVAWYGSAIADIFAPFGRLRRDAQRSGALFNVAVALFDTCIDAHEHDAAELADALNPDRLAARLRRPSAAPLATQNPRCDMLCSLFDSVVVQAGRRFGGEPQLLDHLELLLVRMYESEVRRGARRDAAKVLPVRFICAVADGSLEPARLDLHARFGSLMALLDDWQDLNDDLMRGRANHFVSAHDAQALRTVDYLLRAAWFTALDTATRSARIRRRLGRELRTLLVAACVLEAPRRLALLWVLRDLLGMH
jgi:hypothetical protein